MGFVKKLIPVVFALVTLSASGYASDRISVFVSIVPQKYFLQQIGKGLVQVHVMVQPGASPATYEPKPQQMADLSKAKAYFAIGVPFEDAWLNKIAAANPEMKVVHTDQRIEKLPMATHLRDDEVGPKANSARHGQADRHEAAESHHGGLDPHIWLSPPLVKIQALTILSALKTIDPVHQDVYETNYRRFIAAVDRLDSRLRKLFADRQGLRFMVFHPSWGYFAHAYGIVQVPIEIEGKEPKPAQLQQLIQQARKTAIKVVFVQPQFSARSAELVAREIGGQVAFADPLAEDWMANLRQVAEKFKVALK